MRGKCRPDAWTARQASVAFLRRATAHPSMPMPISDRLAGSGTPVGADVLVQENVVLHERLYADIRTRKPRTGEFD